LIRDRWLLIVDKPSGWPVQPTRAGEANVYEALSAAEPYVGLLHRLDRPASGCLLLTLDPTVNARLAAGFREHTIERTYHAILWGRVEDTTWDRPVGERPARTHVRALGHGSGFTAAEITLENGRTHQIRRHAAQAGHPIAGDRRYGGDAGRAWERLALHASALALRHSVTGAPLEVHAPVPADLAALWQLAGGTSHDA